MRCWRREVLAGWKGAARCPLARDLLRTCTFPVAALLCRDVEWHTWTDEEIAAYEGRWPIGSVERTAFALLLFTGQRMSAVSRMAWSDVAKGCVGFNLEKPTTVYANPIVGDPGRVIVARAFEGCAISIGAVSVSFDEPQLAIRFVARETVRADSIRCMATPADDDKHQQTQHDQSARQRSNKR